MSTPGGLKRKIRILRRIVGILRVCWYNIWGALFFTIKWYRGAELVFRRGLRFAGRENPEFADDFTTWIIFTYAFRGDKATAHRLLEERIEANPSKARYYFDMAEYYMLNGEKQPASQYYYKALGLEKNEEWRSMIRAEISRLEGE